MEYATNYDVGDRRRDGGVNEDGVAVAVFEQGHRGGYRGRRRPVARRDGQRDTPDGESEAPDDRTTTAAPANRSVAVFALADGAGGYEAGDAAAYLATTAVCEELAATGIRAARTDADAFGIDLDDPLGPAPRAGDLESAVAAAIVTAHREIVEYAAATGTQAHATVVAGIAVGGHLHYGWVGDSRAYLVNERRATITPVTKDHAVVEALADAGELDDVEARVHPRNNEITRALGGTGEEDTETTTVQVDTNTVPLYADDVVLATSDGLVDAQTEALTLYERYHSSDGADEAAARVRDRVVTDGEIRDRVLDAPTLDRAAADLVGLANDRGGSDNVSTLLFRDRALDATPDALPDRTVGADDPVEDRQTRVRGGD